jgi:YidC/Oxa1 family membrane protein insertase
MDNQRLFLWGALALVLWLNYTTWERDYAPPPTPAATVTSQQSAAAPASTESLPSLPSTTAPGAPPVPTAVNSASTAAPVEAAPTIHVVTDVLDMDISLRGGELQRADLPKYPKVKNQPDNPMRLLNRDNLYVVRSGVRLAEQQQEPTHLAMFTAPAQEFRLKPGDTKLEVPLTWTDGNGVTVTKTYTFEPGHYRIGLKYDVDNQSGKELKGASYVQIVRHYEHVERSYFNVETYAYRGPAIYDGKAYRKLSVEDDEDKRYRGTVTGGWLAALQHHFVAAAVPAVDVPYSYELNVDPQNNFTLSYLSPLVAIPAAGKHTFTESLFVGPKLQDQLEATGPALDRVADYGKLTIISKPLFILLSWLHEFVGNWGLAIILCTFLIKLAFYKLTAASGRSMAKMRNLSPRIKAIQERYKDDREQLGRQMMEIYKREKINPLAGCLPILIQIPVFLAFYWVLLESVEMRQAPFFGWITDLSSKDPFFILPVIMGAAMFLQFKLQPMPSTDPMQAKIFAFMPVIMAGTMVMFPSGLVLYWLTNTLLSIAQQYRINKLVAAEEKKIAT